MVEPCVNIKGCGKGPSLLRSMGFRVSFIRLRADVAHFRSCCRFRGRSAASWVGVGFWSFPSLSISFLAEEGGDRFSVFRVSVVVVMYASLSILIAVVLLYVVLLACVKALRSVS